jgi:hypothetical protein
MKIHLKTKYMDEDVELVLNQYASDPTGRSIRIDGRDPATGEPVCTFTAFVQATPRLPSNRVILKDYSENEGYPEALVAAGLGKIIRKPESYGVIFEITNVELLALMEAARCPLY